MNKEYVEQIRGILDTLDIPYQWHSFLTVPANAHRFATYYIPKMSFDGDDLRAQYFDYTLDVNIFTRKYFKDEDMEFEEQLEELFRDYGSFTKTSGYDSSNELFVSTYHFNFKEFFIEE